MTTAALLILLSPFAILTPGGMEVIHMGHPFDSAAVDAQWQQRTGWPEFGTRLVLAEMYGNSHDRQGQPACLRRIAWAVVKSTQFGGFTIIVRPGDGWQDRMDAGFDYVKQMLQGRGEIEEFEEGCAQ